MNPITLGAGGNNNVVFWDERDASKPDRLMSVTLASADESESWGEFLTREDAFALLGWLTTLLVQTEA